ncbi:MAG: glycosyltransferase [Clostridia bacterium]|nr:glycosyltransferase [Clostridia bacterium]
MKFSLCMIVKNEEAVLSRCLDSVKDVFDEIIIVDTGSSDRTKQIASEYTDKIYDYRWINDFSAARNFSFLKATGDYIMWLDADDILKEEDRLALLSLKKSISPETDVVMMKYATAFDASGNPSFFYYRERLVKRMANFRWHGFVHEVITPKGNIVYEDITVCHKPIEGKKKDTARNLNIYKEKLAKGVVFSARETYYYARELYYNGQFTEAAKQLDVFLDNPKGWFADKIGACLMLYGIYGESDPAKAKKYLSLALSYDTVNPQVLCFMGDSHKNEGRFHQAIFWYNAALMCPSEYKASGFILPEYERYYPLLQLCVCYDSLGEYGKAKECNRLAGLQNPDSEQVLHNNRYFENLKSAKEEKNSSEN